MKLGAIVALFALLLAPLPAAAQTLFVNPFADAATYRGQRGATSDAQYRVRYEVTRVTRGGAPAVTELTLDVADNWALAREGDVTRLYDFQLNRVFTLNADSFTSMNALGPLVFRLMERQNRTYLGRIVAAAGAQNQLPDACDAESELAVIIPSATDTPSTEWRERRGVFTLRCAGREIGGFTAGDGAAPPAAFWPVMFAEMSTHPALHRRVRESGLAPAQMNISFRDGGNAQSQRAWRLTGAETVATPYPLTASLRNATADAMDQLAPGVGSAGAEAVAGRHLGGVPTLQSWDAHLREISRRDGEAAAAMLVGNTFNMFPELQCARPEVHTACDLIFKARRMPDPGPWATIEISVAEQRSDNAGAIAAMTRAQNSQFRDHPALGAAFALAILKFDANAIEQARAANLPLDIAALQNRALAAFPYNPGYWTDAGDRYARNYEWPIAFMFYDVAYALPLASVPNNPILVAKRAGMEQIRRDFSDAFLPVSP